MRWAGAAQTGKMLLGEHLITAIYITPMTNGLPNTVSVPTFQILTLGQSAQASPNDVHGATLVSVCDGQGK